MGGAECKVGTIIFFVETILIPSRCTRLRAEKALGEAASLGVPKEQWTWFITSKRANEVNFPPETIFARPLSTSR